MKRTSSIMYPVIESYLSSGQDQNTFRRQAGISKSTLNYWLHQHPTDMRKSFDGLCGLVRSEMKRDPMSGHVFIFLNRRRTHVKLLVWDCSGFVLYYKRLEEGTFERPASQDSALFSDVLPLSGLKPVP